MIFRHHWAKSVEGRRVEAPEKRRTGLEWAWLISQRTGEERDFCLSMVFRILHEVPLRGIRLMYVRERDEGRRGRRKGDVEGIMNYL